MSIDSRLDGVRRRLAAEMVDALLVTNMINIRYLTGFTGTNAYLLITPNSARFYSDGRYAVQAARQVSGSEVNICVSHAEVSDALSSIVKGQKLRRVAYESTDVTVASRGPSWEAPPGLDKVMTYLVGAEAVPAAGWIEELREVKDADEIASIRRAAELGDAGFDYIRKKVKPGVTERELALDLEFFLRSEGSEGMSFDPIVAAAENSALPHAQPTDRAVESGGFVLFDFGCIVDGYCSDMTRTLVVGPLDDRHREVYETVLAAQSAGLATASPGVPCGDVDRAARRVVEDAGYAEAFMHGVGHGVGLQIHEAPSLKIDRKEPLEPGHVITVEPGAYFEGWGGIRIEDLAAVTPDGLDVLSRAPRELIVV
ncbi:MAG: aminopeptidase P family protein [Actinobacteria bacterium]|nr:aminopeptidase P family protein [Actinomycetota bacterium]